MIRLPAPAALDGGQLTEQIEAAGFTNVHLTIVGDELFVDADGLVSGVPSDDARQEAVTAAIAQLEESTQASADEANAAAIKTIGPVVADHVPVPPAPLTPVEKLAAVDLTPEDLKALLGV